MIADSHPEQFLQTHDAAHEHDHRVSTSKEAPGGADPRLQSRHAYERRTPRNTRLDLGFSSLDTMPPSPMMRLLHPSDKKSLLWAFTRTTRKRKKNAKLITDREEMTS